MCCLLISVTNVRGLSALGGVPGLAFSGIWLWAEQSRGPVSYY